MWLLIQSNLNLTAHSIRKPLKETRRGRRQACKPSKTDRLPLQAQDRHRCPRSFFRNHKMVTAWARCHIQCHRTVNQIKSRILSHWSNNNISRLFQILRAINIQPATVSLLPNSKATAALLQFQLIPLGISKRKGLGPTTRALTSFDQISKSWRNKSKACSWPKNRWKKRISQHLAKQPRTTKWRQYQFRILSGDTNRKCRRFSGYKTQDFEQCQWLKTSDLPKSRKEQAQAVWCRVVVTFRV